MNREELEVAHKHSIYNEEELKKSGKCGCFFCLKIFEPTEIDTYLTERNGLKTGWCPYCGIDSLIGDASGYAITDEFLKEMNEVFF